MTTSRPLIGLLGKKGAGKDTLAALLREQHGYERLAFADALKRETYEAFGRDLLHRLMYNDWAWDGGTDLAGWMDFIDAHKYDVPTDTFGWIRPLLQFWGTEYRRKLCGGDYWVRQLVPHLGPGRVVTDVRFPDEADAIRAAGGVLVRIDRPGTDSADSHASEREMERIAVDLVLLNDKGIDDLRDSARALPRFIARGLAAVAMDRIPTGVTAHG